VHDQNETSTVLRSTVQRAEGAPGHTGTTNYRFDTHSITEQDLSDPDIVARLNALSKVGLIEYRREVKDPAVAAYITELINKMPALPPCTPVEATQTSNDAEAGRAAGLNSVVNAVRALGTVATPDLLCAFASNFNTPGTDPAFQTRRLIVARRLGALASRMKTAVAYACKPADDPVCMGGKTSDTVAYVSGGKPPINFCPIFRDFDASAQEAFVIHEFAHLVGNVDDSGGYAFSGRGAALSDPECKVGNKFKATGDVLINTADALAGFVMHMETASATQAAPTGQVGAATPGTTSSTAPGATSP
jgi:hypothetical protein